MLTTGTYDVRTVQQPYIRMAEIVKKAGGKKGTAAPELPRFGRVRSNLKVN